MNKNKEKWGRGDFHIGILNPNSPVSSHCFATHRSMTGAGSNSRVILRPLCIPREKEVII